MPTRSQLLPVLGPLLDIGPRVLVLLLAGVVALAAATTCARAIRLWRPLWFLGGWVVGGVAVIAAQVGAASLAAYGYSGWRGGDGVPGGLSVAGVVAFVQPRWLVIAVSVGFGVAMSVALALLRRGPAARNSVSGAEAVEDRAARIGRAGERLVAAELVLLGWPALHNVILVDERGMTSEIDHLVRVPDGIVVLETKTYAGFVRGAETDRYWNQHLADGRRNDFLNPALQNLAHVRAVERFVADPSVRVRGFVVSAGNARLAPEIQHVAVPVRVLRDVLVAHVAGAVGPPDRIEHAWSRLNAEAACSEGRRTAHLARVYVVKHGRFAGFGFRRRA